MKISKLISFLREVKSNCGDRDLESFRLENEAINSQWVETVIRKNGDRKVEERWVNHQYTKL